MLPIEHSPAPEPSIPSGIKVTPAQAALLPGMATPLAVDAVDQNGKTLHWPQNAVSYRSSDAAVVTIDTRGVVTAVSVGKAIISTTITLNGVSATGTTTIDVVELRPGSTYSFSAPIDESGWGMSGTYTAVFKIWQDAPNGPTGTFENFRLIGADGTTAESYGAGTIKFSGYQALQFELLDSKGNELLLFSIQSYRDGGYDGTFTAPVGDGIGTGQFRMAPIGN